jgi:hypothetical protein
MTSDIRESARVLEDEQMQVRSQFGREREQQSSLNELGLSEIEALDYVLQLSRDEEEQRLTTLLALQQEEGIFDTDFDEFTANQQTPIIERSELEMAPYLSDSGSSISGGRPQHSPSPPSRMSPIAARSQARMIPIGSTSRVQIAQREPMEAGFSRSYSQNSDTPGTPIPLSGDEQHFPPMSRTPSSASATSSVPSTPSVVARSTASSPSWSRVASSYSLAAASPPSAPTSLTTRTMSRGSPARPEPSSPVTAMGRIRSDPLSARDVIALPRMNEIEENDPLASVEEDADLRFAIELSLAEARSRGDIV